MKSFIKDDAYHIMYDSLYDFFKNTDPKSPPENINPKNLSTHSDVIKGDRNSWRYGDEENRETYHDVRFDQKKGKTICEEEVKKTLSNAEYKKLLRLATTYRKKISFTDTGLKIDVPKAISGEDRYFRFQKNAKKPVVKIAINICGSASVDADAFRKIASTAIPTIYALEQAGIATEVWYTAFAKGTHEVDEFEYSCTHVKLKSAEQRFNWTLFAPVFCLGSYRDSIFMSWVYSEYVADHGLGRPVKDSELQTKKNFGYTSVIGLNAPGPVSTVKTIFEQIKSS